MIKRGMKSDDKSRLFQRTYCAWYRQNSSAVVGPVRVELRSTTVTLSLKINNGRGKVRVGHYSCLPGFVDLPDGALFVGGRIYPVSVITVS